MRAATPGKMTLNFLWLQSLPLSVSLLFPSLALSLSLSLLVSRRGNRILCWDTCFT